MRSKTGQAKRQAASSQTFGILGKSVCMRSARRTISLSLKDPGHDPGVGWLSSSPGGWLGPIKAVLVAVWQVMALSSNVSSVFP